jgi:hypothetical protein
LTPTGFEPVSASPYAGKDLGKSLSAGAAKSGAVSADMTPADPDLADGTAAWPKLPEDVRKGIMALVERARRNG